MSKNKKFFLTLTVIIVIITVLFCIYIIYGNTKISFENDSSIINYLSANKDDSVTILAKEKYKNYAAVMYTVSTDEKIHFVYFEKNPYFYNRYNIKGGGSTNNGIDCTKVQNDNGELIFFIYNNDEEESKCSLFQIASDGMINNKIEEIDTPAGPYIIVKEYNFDDKESEILAFEGSKTIEEINQYF